MRKRLNIRRDYLLDGLGVSGVALVAVGLAKIYVPAAYIFLGVLFICASVYAALLPKGRK